MLVGYKYKLLPSEAQIEILNQWEGSTRWLWNNFLSQNITQYATDKKFIWRYDLSSQLPNLKKQFNWLSELPSQSLQKVALSIDRALHAIKKSKFGFPRFKKKGVSNGQIKIDQTNNHIKTSETHIKIPKIGNIKWIYHRDLPNGLRSISITKDIDQWYVSCLCKIEDQQQVLIDRDNCVGIDLGIKAFAVTSDNEITDSPKFLKRSLNKLKWKQRKLSHKVKGSRNRNKERIKVAKLHRKIRNQRLNFLHQTSRRLVNKYDLICTEDLKTKDLLKKKNRTMNRAISDQGWSMFLAMLKYKCQLYGKHFGQISQWAASTKTCNACGYKHQGFGLGIRIWTCPNCKATLDRDLNAAQNIAFWGQLIIDSSLFKHTVGTTEIQACGDVPLTSMKQETASLKGCGSSRSVPQVFDTNVWRHQFTISI
jgi:putative transposase